MTDKIVFPPYSNDGNRHEKDGPKVGHSKNKSCRAPGRNLPFAAGIVWGKRCRQIKGPADR